jgi:sialidase-1
MNFVQTDIFNAGTDGVAIYRIPALLAAPGGALLAFCEARKESCNDATPTNLVVKRSLDGGRTWLPMQVVVRGTGPEAIMNPCPVVDGKTVHLFCMNAHKTGRGRHRYLFLSSSDDGATWTDAVDITGTVANGDDTFVPGPGVSIRMRNGRWVVPGGTKTFTTGPNQTASSAVESHLDQATCSPRVIYSDDGGHQWRLGQAVATITGNESQVVELADGTLMLNWREQNYRGPSAGCRGIAFSKDGGETWSDPTLARELPETPCQASLVRYSLAGKGIGLNRLLFSNPDASTLGEVHKARTRMTVRLSNDDGRTWPVSRLINPGPSAYSCLAVLPDGMIGLLYECGEAHPYERIRLALFSLEWLTTRAG